MVGGETCGGCGWRGRGARGGGFISGGMLSVSKDTHFTHTGQKHTAHPHRRSSCLRPPSLLDHFYLSNLIYPRSRFFLIFSSFVSNLFSPPSLPPVLHHTLCSALHLIYPLHLFRFCRAPTLRVSLTLSLLSPVPSSRHVTPISVSPVCFLTAQTIISFSFFLPRTRQYQNSAELLWRMGVFFFFFPEWVCFSL